jgi:hypothetical protein
MAQVGHLFLLLARGAKGLFGVLDGLGLYRPTSQAHLRQAEYMQCVVFG